MNRTEPIYEAAVPAETPSPPTRNSITDALPFAVVGEFIQFADDRTPLVLVAALDGGAAIRARTTVKLDERHIGQSVVLVFEAGDARRPIIVGIIRPLDDAVPRLATLGDAASALDVATDGGEAHVSARERLVLSCGAASITLTRAGKLLIEGAYLISRSSGPNKIRGARIELN
jgi:hypothetical protein